ncbi:hypothetical protein Tco_1548447 [Tanacetum coccineum]
MPVPFIYTSRLSFEKGTGRTGGQNSQFYRLILVGSLLQKEPTESCYNSFHISFVVFHTLDVNVPSKEHYDPVSYDNALNDNTTKPKVNFHTLESDVPDEADFDIMIPIASVDEYGTQKVTVDASGFFFLKFSYAQGAEEVLWNGPWMIRGTPIFLNKWSPSNGLSRIATKLGTPMMLGSYTSDMCLEACGHNIYVRAMIEIDAHKEMIDTMVVVVPKLNDIGYTCVTIRIKYEWKLSRCGTCAVFGHTLDRCTKVVLIRTFVVNNNGNATVLANHFDVLNMVVNEEDVTPSSVLGATFAKNGLSRGNNKASDLGADESDSEAEEVFNETTSFMAPKQPKVSSSSRVEGGGNEKSSLCEQ